MKKIYDKPEMVVNYIKNSDVITVSTTAKALTKETMKSIDYGTLG